MLWTKPWWISMNLPSSWMVQNCAKTRRACATQTILWLSQAITISNSLCQLRRTCSQILRSYRRRSTIKGIKFRTIREKCTRCSWKMKICGRDCSIWKRWLVKTQLSLGTIFQKKRARLIGRNSYWMTRPMIWSLLSVERKSHMNL